MKKDISFLVELSESELIEIEGGDRFTSDLGRLVGTLGGYAYNLLQSFGSSENIGGPTANHY